MFGILESLTKAVVGTVVLPVKVVADVVTLGGAIVDKDQPYTVDGVEEIMKNLGNATNPNK